MTKPKRNLILGVALALIVAFAAPAAADYRTGPGYGWGAGRMTGWYGCFAGRHDRHQDHRYWGGHGPSRRYYDNDYRSDYNGPDRVRPGRGRSDRNNGRTW